MRGSQHGHHVTKAQARGQVREEARSIDGTKESTTADKALTSAPLRGTKAVRHDGLLIVRRGRSMQQINRLLDMSVLEQEEFQRGERLRAQAAEQAWRSDFPNVYVDKISNAEAKRARRRARNLVHCS